MTRAEARRRRKRKREMQRAVAWVVFYAVELFVAAIPTAITAAIVLPLAYRSRGYYAMGGEWLAIILVFVIAYTALHEWLCNKMFEEG